MTIREYLNIHGGSQTGEDALRAIQLVGLEQTVMTLDDGMDTQLAVTGWPLTTAEAIQLKLAATLITKPRVLVLSQLLDTVADEYLQRTLDTLQQETECTVIYFTGRHRKLNFTDYMLLGAEHQELYPSYAALSAAAGSTADDASDEPTLTTEQGE